MNRREMLAGVSSLIILSGCENNSEIYRSPRRTVTRMGNALIADLVVYGATPSGVTAAIQGARDGLSVLLLGGWRDKHLGGMMTGGLGYTDLRRIEAFGGLASEITIAAAQGGTAKNKYAFLASNAQDEFERLIHAEGIPFVRSTGVVRVDRQRNVIQAIHTANGLSVRGRVFVDASYEGDLMVRAGVSSIVGRDRADRNNPLDGYRGATQTAKGNAHQFGMRDTLLTVDPFVTPGDPSSGLLPTVKTFPSTEIGAADAAIQAYNFRLMMTNEADKRLDLPVNAPPGYDASQYELLLRYVAAIEAAGMKHGRDWHFAGDLIGSRLVSPGVYDVNADGGFSTDCFGLSWPYPNAGYADRETIWKAHENFTRGFFYTLAWSNDPRLPASLQNEVRTWGLVKGQFADPHENDTAGWPYQLYVREARRLDNGKLWSGSDLEKSDHAKLRYGTPVAMASYWQDSHHVQRLAIPVEGGGYKVWNEGNMFAQGGGDDRMSPLPYEIMLPRQSECANLLVTFCVAASHQAFSSIRMELTSMSLGQVAGAAAALACTGKTSVASIDRSALRRKLDDIGVVINEPSAFDKIALKIKRRIQDII